MQTPALTWRVRRIGRTLWSAVCARRHTVWLSSHAARAGKRAADAPAAYGACAATGHWLAAARAQGAG